MLRGVWLFQLKLK